MSRTIPAIFDEGVFRPLTPVDLPEGTPVVVQLESPTQPTPDEEPRADENPPSTPAEGATGELSPEELARQQAQIAEFLAKMEAIPHEGPDDGFSGRDHDKILYGKP